MKQWLWQPVDIASLVFFRIVFGVLGFADLLGGFAYYHLWVDAFNPTKFQFKYYGFQWVSVFPEPFMSLFFLLGMGLAVAVALGWRYRITAPLFAAFFTYYFFLEKAHYLNHAYLFCWISWVMALLPAWRGWSLDVWRDPTQRSATVPRWSMAILPFLMGVVYFFGGIAKLNPDWMLNAMPLKLWLHYKKDLFLIGPLVALPATAWIMSVGGALFDLSISFLMLGKRTRKLGFALAIGFHLTNHVIFNIGIFPYLSVALTAMFFPPSWPRHLLFGVRIRWQRAAQWYANWMVRMREVPGQPVRFWQNSAAWRSPVLAALVVIVTVHCVLPLRHWCFPNDVAWTEEGHRYAWRMMLRGKQGRGTFLLRDRATGKEEVIRPKQVLSDKQARKMLTHPDMILQYAHYLRDQALAEGRDVAVFARVRVRLNDGTYNTYIDPEVDLSQEEWPFFTTKPWVLSEE